MNKKIIKPIILSITALVILIISTIVYAWYTNVDRVNQEIDGSSDDIVLDYTINDDTSTTTTYSISNLVFFDPNDENETKYLSSMATKIKLNITNVTNKNVNCKISFIVQKYDSTTAYCAAIIVDDDFDTSNSTDKISELDGYNKDLILSLEEKEDSLDVKNIYLYIFGVQTNDSANNDFLYTSTYKFSIQIEASVSTSN